MKEKEFLPYVRDRLGIELLNPMQKKMMSMATEPGDIMLLAPTGSGKTLPRIILARSGWPKECLSEIATASEANLYASLRFPDS